MTQYIDFSQLESLAEKKLITFRHRDPHWVTIKYHRRVMFDDLWSKHPEILEARGHTYHSVTGQLVVVPPEKTFDWDHRGIPRPANWMNDPVTAYRKYNGSMLALTNFNGEPLISTTGSTQGEFVDRGREILEQTGQLTPPPPGETWVFEIVTDQDPHIVDDPQGAHLLGRRVHATGQWIPQPDHHTVYGLTRGEAIEMARTSTGEGYMIVDQTGLVVKAKSDLYRGKKRLMRMSQGDLDRFWLSNDSGAFRIPASWRQTTAVLKSQCNLSQFKGMDEWNRRLKLEEILKLQPLGLPATSTGVTKTS